MVTTTVNNLRSTKFGLRGKASFVTNDDIQIFVVNDLKMLENQDIDLQAQITSLVTGALIKKLSYTVGVNGVTADYNFTSVANTTKQSIQLGATTIIPALATTTSTIATASIALVGGTAVADIGVTSGSDEYISGVALSSLNATTSSSAAVAASGIATSLYFSVTPSANWNTLSLAKWTINIYYLL